MVTCRIITIACATWFAVACASDRHTTIHVDPADAEPATRTTFQFSARIRGSLRGELEWSLETASGLPLEDAGRIDENGLYTAPSAVPRADLNNIVVRARFAANPAITATALVRVTAPPIDPPSGPSTGNTVVRIERRDLGIGREVGPAEEVLFDGKAIPFEAESPYALTATTTAHTLGAVDVSVRYADGATEFYPKAFRYGASELQFSGTETIVSCAAGLLDFELVDVDACGTKDLLLLCGGDAPELHVIRYQNGERSEPERFSVATGIRYIHHLLTADLNSDGWRDVVTDGYDGTFSVLMNRGSATACGTWRGFEPAITTPATPSLYPIAMGAGDFDGDGVLDLAAADHELTALLRGVGDGTFTPYAQVTTQTISGMTVGDFNGDGRSDLAFTLYYSVRGGLQAFFSQGPDVATGIGRFSTYVHYQLTSDCDGVPYTSITSGDRKQLGRDQIFVGFAFENCWSAPALRALTWNNTFNSFEISLLDFIGGDGSIGVVQAGDYNDDGRLDVSYWGSESIYVHWGSGDIYANPETLVSHYKSGSRYTVAHAIADLNGDQLPEFITYGGDTGLTVARGIGSKAFPLFGAPRTSIANSASVGVHLNVAGESLLLISAAQQFGDPVVMFTRDGQPSGAAPTREIPLKSGESLYLPQLIAADLNSDRLEDLVVVGTTYLQGQVYAGAVWIALNSPHGLGEMERLDVELASQTRDACVADVTGDGHADLVVAVYDEEGLPPLAILPGSADGFQMETERTGDPGQFFTMLRCLDVDRDGQSEILTVDGGDSSLTLTRRVAAEDEATYWQHEELTSLATSIYDVLVADTNRDGFDDVVVGGTKAELGGIFVYSNRNGTLDSPDRYLRYNAPRSLTFVDIDADGYGDIVGPSGVGTLLTFRGTPNGRLSSALTHYTGVEASDILGTDFSGDGLTDILLIEGSGAVRHLTNESF